MNILFIAPVPPPINGQSKASKVVLDALKEKQFNVEVVNLSKESLKSGEGSFTRLKEILQKILKVNKLKKNQDIIYLSLAESFTGNLRDLMFFFVNRKKLDKIYVHMLGGAGMKEILSKENIIKKINAYFISRIRGVFVEGNVNYELFRKVITEEKIHIIPNFAEDFLFFDDKEIEEKFQNLETINLLYLSNLINGKGYEELLNGFLLLDDKLKNNFKLTFVGGFESIEKEKEFLTSIKPYKQIHYLGKFIDGIDKRNLYKESHVFCLPTYYPFEGQPISILEGYATGCVVITTNHSGIPYIFTDQENGFAVEKKSPESIKSILEKLLYSKERLKLIAFHNRNTAENKYRTRIFQSKIIKILEN